MPNTGFDLSAGKAAGSKQSRDFLQPDDGRFQPNRAVATGDHCIDLAVKTVQDMGGSCWADTSRGVG